MNENLTSSTPPSRTSSVDSDALLCALVLAPRTFPRNRFFRLYENTESRRVRRRAKRLRSIIRQLSARGREPAEIIGERELQDGRILLRYRVRRLAFERTSSLSQLEAAVLKYALHRSGAATVTPKQKAMVERALVKLGSDLALGADSD